MILWINGAFGSGKTTIARLLNKKLSGSYLYDPEKIGDFFRHNLPQSMQKADFQDYPEWRAWNVHILKKLDQEYDGAIIAPMTLYKTTPFNEIIPVLKETTEDFHHFQLEVGRKEIICRLQERSPSMIEWGASKVDEILEAFKQVPSEEKISNQERTPEAVVKEILDKLS